VKSGPDLAGLARPLKPVAMQNEELRWAQAQAVQGLGV
jgi:hypothetical protein